MKVVYESMRQWCGQDFPEGGPKTGKMEGEILRYSTVYSCHLHWTHNKGH